MMRMLLIWLLVFSTFVGVGCDYVGAPPKRQSQADFVTSHSWLSQADFATSHSELINARRPVAKSISSDVNAMRSYSAVRVAELGQEAGSNLAFYKRIQSECPGMW